MMVGEHVPDPTQSPWVTVEVDGRTRTRCRYCLQFFTAGSDNSQAAINHFKWCDWLAQYMEG
jgi:hypothetical protein